MPLADIGTVCDLKPAEAAEAVTASWQRASVDTAVRARLAALLVEDPSGSGATMSDPNPALATPYGAGCDIGAERASNEDAAYAIDRQLAVADGRRRRDQAAAHPRRALLMRALGTGTPGVEADLALRTALPGDRYLLCSDGLSAGVNSPNTGSTFPFCVQINTSSHRWIQAQAVASIFPMRRFTISWPSSSPYMLILDSGPTAGLPKRSSASTIDSRALRT